LATDFVLDWEKALGYRSDPFADRILLPAHRFIVDRVEEKERLNWFFIKDFFYGSILGENGVGKTMLLKWLEERLNKYRRIHCIYINAAVFKDQINIPQQILEPLLTLIEKYWTKPHQQSVNFDYIGFLKKKLGQKSVAILIDNAHNLTDRNMELIKALREDGLRIQVVIATTQADYEKSRLPEFGSDELNIALRRLTLDESIEMIQKRISAVGGSGVNPFQRENLSRIYDRADKNPRQFLHLCRDEAIRILIHRSETAIATIEADKAAAQTQSPQKKHHKPATLSIPEPQKGVDLNPPKQNKGFFRVKFDMNKDKPGIYPKSLNTPNDPLAPPRFDDKRNLYTNERYNQNLIDKLASAKPKRKQDTATDVSDIDRIIREISDTMKGKE